MDHVKGNRFTKYFPLLLDALRSSDPTPMRPAEAKAWIRAHFDVPQEELNQKIDENGQSFFENDVHWVRFYLVKAGLITKSKRGFWGLTAEGRETHLTPESTRELYVKVRDANRSKDAVDEEVVVAPDSTETDDEAAQSYWFVGAFFNGKDDQTERFRAEGVAVNPIAVHSAKTLLLGIGVPLDTENCQFREPTR